MKRLFDLSLVVMIVFTIIPGFWGKTIVSEINQWQSTTLSLTDVQSDVDLETLVATRTALIETMVQESKQFRYSPCGKNTFCYNRLQEYSQKIDRLNQSISGAGGRDLIWQDGLAGLIDPRLNADGTLSQYKKDRQRYFLRGKLINSRLKTAAVSQSSPRAILTMGGPGSGKSTVLKMFGLCDRDFVQIDADEFKQDLVEYQVAVAAKDRLASSRVHEESSILAKQTRDEAIETKRNLCLDGTLANREKAIALINRLQQNGYEVTVIGALIPYQIAVDRIAKRAEMTGRFIPPEFIQQAYDSIAQNAEAIAQKADYGYLYDTDVPFGATPKLIGLSIKGVYHFRNNAVLKQLSK